MVPGRLEPCGRQFLAFDNKSFASIEKITPPNLPHHFKYCSKPDYFLPPQQLSFVSARFLLLLPSHRNIKFFFWWGIRTCAVNKEKMDEQHLVQLLEQILTRNFPQSIPITSHKSFLLKESTS